MVALDKFNQYIKNKVNSYRERQIGEQVMRRYARENFEKSKIGQTQSRFAQTTKNISRYAVNPSDRYKQFRAGVVRNVRRVMPVRRIVRTNNRGRRGRPLGSTTYYIPGVGRVGVFEFRKYIRAQKNIARAQYAQMAAIQQARMRAAGQYGSVPVQQVSQQVEQQIPRQLPIQAYPEQRSLPVVQPSLNEISIMERSAFNMGINPTGQFVETDLMSGATKQRRVGQLL